MVSNNCLYGFLTIFKTIHFGLKTFNEITALFIIVTVNYYLESYVLFTNNCGIIPHHLPHCGQSIPKCSPV